MNFSVASSIFNLLNITMETIFVDRTLRVLATLWEMQKSIGDLVRNAYRVENILWEIPK